MKSNQGIALVAALLVMVVIMVIGIGSLGLAMMNSRIAENVRSAAVAEASAETGIEAARIMLERAYSDNGKRFPASVDGKFPTTVAIPRINNVASFAATDYTYITSADQKSFSLTVKGRTASGGLHLSEILVAGTSGIPRLRGLVSEGPIRVTGNSTYTDADIHSNAEYNLGGSTFSECTTRNGDGSCQRTVAISPSDVPVTTGNNPVGRCSIRGGSSAVCSGGLARKTRSPYTVTPDYLGIRDAAIRASDVTKATPARSGTTSTLNGIKCDYVSTSSVAPLTTFLVSLISTLTSNHPVLCIDGSGVTLPSVLSNVTIIAKNAVSFTSTPTLTNSTIISRTGGVNIGGKANIDSSKIFSQEDLDISGTQTEIQGISTIASAGDISIGGASKEYTSADGTKSIGLAIIAEGNVTANGRSNWFAEVRAGGDFTKSGTATMYGGVEAKGSITINGGIDIDTGLSIANSDALLQVPTVLSRR